jgi:hypothetical protein
MTSDIAPRVLVEGLLRLGLRVEALLCHLRLELSAVGDCGDFLIDMLI